MIRINLLTAYFPPQRSAGANRMAGFARAFRAPDFDIRVFAARFPDDGLLDRADADLDPITTWIPCNPARRLNLGSRFIDEWHVAFKVFTAAKQRDADFTIITTPYLSFLLLGPVFIARRQLIFDVRDLTWEYRITNNILVVLMQRLLALWSVRSLGLGTLVTATTHAEVSYLIRNSPSASVVHVSNGIDEQTLNELTQLPCPVPESAPYVVVYAGSLGSAQGVEILAAAAETMHEWLFIIAGDGVEMSNLKKLQASRKIGNLRLLGSVPRNVVLAHYRSAGILFLRLRRGFSTAVPSKTYEYLATGKPIVYMGHSGDAAWKLLAQFPGTYRSNDNDLSNLAAVFHEAVSAGSARNTLYERDLTQLTRESQTRKLLDEIRARI